ncbi:MAG TPA: cytochrome c oxidase subunit 3 [Sphingomicrobium sp.]|nr:cytochrome c oxidase subunit 3 [Sphingomicrobium sp.]
MNPFKALAVKPWLADPRPAEEIHNGSAGRLATSRLGLWLFLVVVTVLFLLLTSVYFGRMALPDWDPLQEPRILWLNSGVLILSSIAMERAATSARRRQMAGVRAGLLVGSVLAALFLAGQLEAWRQLSALGYFAVQNPAYAFFYLITALHGLHLMGGLAVLAVAADNAWRSDDAASMRRIARLCAIYWHFLLAVWAVMFGLLLADNSGAIDFIELCRGLAGRLIGGDTSSY